MLSLLRSGPAPIGSGDVCRDISTSRDAASWPLGDTRHASSSSRGQEEEVAESGTESSFYSLIRAASSNRSSDAGVPICWGSPHACTSRATRARTASRPARTAGACGRERMPDFSLTACQQAFADVECAGPAVLDAVAGLAKQLQHDPSRLVEEYEAFAISRCGARAALCSGRAAARCRVFKRARRATPRPGPSRPRAQKDDRRRRHAGRRLGLRGVYGQAKRAGERPSRESAAQVWTTCELLVPLRPPPATFAPAH